MSFKINPIIIVISIVVLGIVGFLIFKIHKQSEMISDINTKMMVQKELADNIIRSQDEFAKTKDIENFAKQNNINIDTIKDDLNKLNANVKSINVVSVKSIGNNIKDIKSTNIGEKNPNQISEILECIDNKCINPDKYGYLNSEQKLTLEEPFSNNKVPLGNISFSAWKNAPWGIDLYPREYMVTTIVGEDENQRQYHYNKFSVKVNNKIYDIKIDSSKTLNEYPEAKFHLFNPRLYLGIDGGLNLKKINPQFGPNIGINFMSYGRYIVQPDFTILGIGVGYDINNKNPLLLINPFSYNIGNDLPLINNTYLGPSLTLTKDGDFGVVLNLTVGL